MIQMEEWLFGLDLLQRKKAIKLKKQIFAFVEGKKKTE